MKVDDHLNESSADLEDVLFLQLPSDDQVEVILEVVEYAVEVGFIFDDFFEGGDLFDFWVVHESYVFVLEDFLPIGLLMQFFDGYLLASVSLFCFEEGEPLGFDYALEYAIFFHQFYLLDSAVVL